MIKLTKYIYIHVLTVLLFVYCFITRRLEVLWMTYLIMFIHELFHLGAALAIGLKPSHITFYPFGVNLKLKNKLVYSLSDEIILYLAGPFANILMGLCALIFFRGRAWAYDFYLKNIFLFCLNLLPIVPLDGGVVVKKIMMHRIGYRAAERVMNGISAVFIALFAGLGVYMAVRSSFHFSVCFFVLFLLGNIFVSREKYNIDFVRELMFYKEKGRSFQNRTVKTVLLQKGAEPKELAKRFTLGNYYIVFVVDAAGQIDDILTETQMLEDILAK